MKRTGEIVVKIAQHTGVIVRAVALIALAGCTAQVESVSSGERAAALESLKSAGVHVHLAPGSGTRVVGFNFYHSGASTNELAQVLDFPKISELNISDTDFTDADVLRLGVLTNLEALSVSGMDNLTDNGFTVVTNFTRLRQIEATHMNISDSSLMHLGRLKFLERVSIGPTEPGPTAEGLEAISSRGFAALGGLTNLQSVYIVGRRVLPLQLTDNDLTALAGATNLTSLTLSSCPLTGVGLRHLNAAHLKSLRMKFAAVNEAGIKAIAEFPDLESLNLYGNHLEDCLTPFSNSKNFRSLKTLSLMETGVGDSDVALLAKLPALERLTLYGCPVTDDALHALSRLHTLKYLDVTRTDVSEEAAEQLQRDAGVQVQGPRQP
jgi:Leucine-rich repeat (LRR) protein